MSVHCAAFAEQSLYGARGHLLMLPARVPHSHHEPQAKQDTDAALSCPICNVEFRGYRRLGLSWTSICSEKGFDVIFQAVTMFIMALCCIGVGALVVYDQTRAEDPKKRRHHQKMRYVRVLV
eukprot:SAG22_NODE_952_length_6343_cov_3.567265_4_plen_122_part_00